MKNISIPEVKIRRTLLNSKSELDNIGRLSLTSQNVSSRQLKSILKTPSTMRREKKLNSDNKND
jgi:hypothetical protein